MGLNRTQLTEIAKSTGYPVKAAWVEGHGEMGEVEGVVLHHTGSSDSIPGDYPTLRVVTEGRPGLDGPLCNFGIGRSGTIYLISEGVGWHAGVGEFRGITKGNSRFLGIEAESGGAGVWSEELLDSYARLTAAILHYIGKDASWAIRHAEWALPKGRKNDTAGIDMAKFRAKVTAMLAKPETINRNYNVEEDMTPDQMKDVFTDWKISTARGPRSLLQMISAADGAATRIPELEKDITSLQAEIAALRVEIKGE